MFKKSNLALLSGIRLSSKKYGWNVLFSPCAVVSDDPGGDEVCPVFQMTPGEMKFALQVELVLNRIPQPEYRQLMVEAMMVLVLIVQHDGGATYWNQEIYVDQLVRRANEIFIEEQVSGCHVVADLNDTFSVLNLFCASKTAVTSQIVRCRH